MTSFCPSHDWDRYVNEQDEAAEAQRAFYKQYQDQILLVACALLASGNYKLPEDQTDRNGLAEEAAHIVQTIVYRGQEEE